MIIIEAFNSAFNLSEIINYIGNVKGITFKLKLFKIWGIIIFNRKITFEHFDIGKCFQNQRKSNGPLLSINDIVVIVFLIMMQDQGSYSVIASIVLPRFFNIIEQPYYILFWQFPIAICGLVPVRSLLSFPFK